MSYQARGRLKRHKAKRDNRFRYTKDVTHMRVSTATRKDYEAKCAAFHAAAEAKRATDATYRRAKKAVESVPDGAWGEYVKTFGNPRTIQDNDAVEKRFEVLGETVPTKLAYPLLVRKVESS